MFARVFPVKVPLDVVMFPDVLIVPLALKVVPALIEPSDEIFPCDVILPAASIVVCVVRALVDNIEQLGGETAGSPIFNPLLHLTVPSKLPVPVVKIEPADMFPSDVIVAPCILLSEVIFPLLSISHFTAHVLRPT